VVTHGILEELLLIGFATLRLFSNFLSKNRWTIAKKVRVSFAQILKSGGNPNHGAAGSGHGGQFVSSALTGADISEHLAEHGLKKFDTPEFRDQWLKYLPKVTPTEFLHGMFGKIHTTEGNFKDMEDFGFRGGQLQIQAANCYVHGAEARVYHRTFYFKGEPKSVYHNLLDIKEADQGGGAVKRLFKEAIPLYRKMGIENVSLLAGMERGAYAWPKYGFNYDDPDIASEHIKHIKQRLNTQVAFSPEDLPKPARDEYEALSTILRDTENKTKLWNLTDAKTPALDEHFGAEIIYNDDKKPTFIKSLFRATSYSASLNIKDPVAMSRLAKYVSQ
jgi:hypothetical protein